MYNLKRLDAVESTSYEHIDPSIYTVLTAPHPSSGTVMANFISFPLRWTVQEGSLHLLGKVSVGYGISLKVCPAVIQDALNECDERLNYDFLARLLRHMRFVALLFQLHCLPKLSCHLSSDLQGIYSSALCSRL